MAATRSEFDRVGSRSRSTSASGSSWSDISTSATGDEADLNRNLLALIEATGLTAAEVREFGRLQRKRIRRYGSRR